ncbi:hypothetical protein RV10_GL002432 [Enterococcus pallens]|nr:hypothetical protein RV10_GL002432 [Enterococcus pallens]
MNAQPKGFIGFFVAKKILLPSIPLAILFLAGTLSQGLFYLQVFLIF